MLSLGPTDCDCVFCNAWFTPERKEQRIKLPGCSVLSCRVLAWPPRKQRFGMQTNN